MGTAVNDGLLCVLAFNPQTHTIEVRYKPYDIPHEASMQQFARLCASATSSLATIANYIASSADVDVLAGEYRYCEELDGTYQTFKADKKRLLTDIAQHQQFIELQTKLDRNFNSAESLLNFKQMLVKCYTKWCKAYAIQKAYRQCHDDTTILSFSHRICGWSNPVHRLTANFSLELKTNFGYGWSSYFYIKMRYKSIDILPFSHWVQYEHAKFSEIVRYSQKYLLQNSEWVTAMQYSQQACNLSLNDEQAFVEKYIVEECEAMAKGLEELFANGEIKARNQAGQLYKVDKQGYPLTEFRGEKISGALDFISKMLEFDRITSVKKFIVRIEQSNKKIQPILLKELIELKPKIAEAKSKMSLFQPGYQKSLEQDRKYNAAKVVLKQQIALQHKVRSEDVDWEELNKAFEEKYPDYQTFTGAHKLIVKQYFALNQEIKNLHAVFQSILSYSNKIASYFA